MRILYVSLSYLPSRRASSVQVMKMCSALGRAGHQVTLVAKQGAEPSAVGKTLHEFFGVAPTFAIQTIARPARRGGGAIYAAGVARALAAARGQVDLVYCRDVVGFAMAVGLGLPVVFEAHAVPTAGWQRAILRRGLRRANARGVVSISAALDRDLVAEGLVPADANRIIAHDAAEPPVRASSIGAAGRPPRVGYVGNLYPGRGVEMLVALAAKLPTVEFVVVGGQDKDLAHWRAQGVAPNLSFLGFRPQRDLPALYATFDLVLMPHARTGVVGATGDADISKWTSPMKMFEYMASGVALIASDLPVLGEVLRHDGNAWIAAAEDVPAWQLAVETLLADDARRARLAAAAQADLVAHYTWDARAENVMRALGA